MAEYINREKAIEAIKQTYCSHCNSYNGAMCRACEHQDDMDIIEDTKAADVQPVKHGRWITWDDSGFTKCSCCNSEYYISDLQVVGDSEGFVDFCPNCGARMDGEAQC